jgi:hypothetical protein
MIAGIFLMLVAASVLLMMRGGIAARDRPGDSAVDRGKMAAEQKPCGSKATYNAVQRELFRQAAETRGSDASTFDRIAAYASLRVERPILKSRDEDIGTLRCTGRLSLDLPPGLAVVGSRRTLSGDVDYILQPAADGSGNVVILEGADPIIIPLATLAQVGSQPGLPQLPQLPPAMAEREAIPVMTEEPRDLPGAPSPGEPTAPVVDRPQAPQPAATASARPSFNCRYARTRGEVRVCSDGGLAGLDRQMASQFYRAVASSDAQRREQLRSTRNRFLRYRDACRSDACIAAAYRERMVEISDIAQGRWRPPR